MSESDISATSAGDADITNLMQAIDEKTTEMKEKIKNGEVQDKFQTGSTSFTNEEWKRLINKFDASEEAVKKATLEKSQNTTEIQKQQASEENQHLQQTTENTGAHIVAHLYEQYKGHSIISKNS